jgi:hypothetical protein
MPERNCGICDLEPEARPGARLCRGCLALAAGIYRELQATDRTPDLPLYITSAWMKEWAVKAVADVRYLSPVAHILRGIVQGALLAHELMLETPDAAALIQLELVAIQAMREVRG